MISKPFKEKKRERTVYNFRITALCLLELSPFLDVEAF